MQANLSDFKGWLAPDPSTWNLQEAIHVWRFNASSFSASSDSLFKVLSPAERLRAEACSSIWQRQKFTYSRFALRKILSRYLSIAPEEISLTSTPRGKLELQDFKFQFNLSHSGSWLLFAFAAKQRIGIDVEKVRPRAKLVSLARRCLSYPEFTIFGKAPDEEKLRLFYRSWTLKEALLKSWGEGLRIGMKKIQILSLSTPGEFFDYQSELRFFSCQLRMLPQLASDYVGALAVEGELGEVKFWDASFLC